jgi:hypothetical protein
MPRHSRKSRRVHRSRKAKKATRTHKRRASRRIRGGYANLKEAFLTNTQTGKFAESNTGIFKAQIFKTDKINDFSTNPLSPSSADGRLAILHAARKYNSMDDYKLDTKNKSDVATTQKDYPYYYKAITMPPSAYDTFEKSAKSMIPPKVSGPSGTPGTPGFFFNKTSNSYKSNTSR